MNVIWNNIALRVRPGCTVQEKEPTYIGCTNDFLDFQEFAEWCDAESGYRKKDPNGKPWELDKDLVFIGNKSYSSANCCFIPQTVNKLLNCRENSRGNYPMGVRFEVNASRIRAGCRNGKTDKFLGYFDDPMDGHKAWQAYKILQIEKLLVEFNDLPEVAVNGLELRIKTLKNHLKSGKETLFL